MCLGDYKTRRNPRIICPSKCNLRRLTDTVLTHVQLLGFGDRFTIGFVADDVVRREALGLEQFCRLQHPQADIVDHIRRAFDGDQGQRSKVVILPLQCSKRPPADSEAAKTSAQYSRRRLLTLHFLPYRVIHDEFRGGRSDK